MNNKEISQWAVENFLCKGGVVLAANDSKSIVGIRGTFEKISENFIKVLVGMSVAIIKKNPEDFEILVAATMSHLLALAEIAEKKYDAPQLSKDVIYRVAMSLCWLSSTHYKAHVRRIGG